MRYVAQWSEIQRYAPGSYKQALLSEFFFSLAERKQAASLAQTIKLHPDKPTLGEAWFPTVQDTPLPFGILIKIQIHSGHLPQRDEDKKLDTKAIEDWMLINLGASPIPFPTLSISDIPPGWKLEGNSWHLAGLCAVVSKVLQIRPAHLPIASGTIHAPSNQKPHFSSVQHIEKKQKLCRWEFPENRPFLLDTDDNNDHFIAKIESWFAELFGHSWKQKARSAMRLSKRAIAESAYHQYRYGEKEQAEQLASTLAGELTVNTEMDHLSASYIHYVLGASQKRKKKTFKAQYHLEEALKHYEAHNSQKEFDLFFPFEITANLGIACYHSLRIKQGIHLVSNHLKELQKIPEHFRDVRWTQLAVRLGGTLRWLYLGGGETTLALSTLQKWALSKHQLPNLMCRALYEQADLFWRLGRFQEAKEALIASEAYFEDVFPNDRALSYRFLRLYKIRVGLEEQPPLPPQQCNRLIEQLEYYEYSLATSPSAFLRVAQTQMNRPEFNLYRCYIISGFTARALKTTLAMRVNQDIKNRLLHINKTIALRLLEKSDNLPEETCKALKSLHSGVPDLWIQCAPY